MRIAVVSTPFVRVPPRAYGGTELFCFELVEELALRGHQVTLFATGDSTVRCATRSRFARPVWPPCVAIELDHLAWSFAEVAAGTFDIVHVNSAYALPFARFARVPIVCTMHHPRDETQSQLFVAHPEVHYVAISRRQLDLEVSLPRGVVIHHGLSPSRYPASVSDDGYLLHLGRFAASKGTHLAIDAARAAGMRLLLAGRVHAFDREYFDEEVETRLGPGVENVGEAGVLAKRMLLQGARALLCPLQWEEPFGLVAIEAMLSGTPVIGFARGSFPEIVDEGVTGFLRPGGDVDALASVARGLGAFDRDACARRARERFSAACMVDAYERLYRRAIAVRHAA